MSADTSDSGNLPAPESAADLAGADSPSSAPPGARVGSNSQSGSKPTGSLISVAEPKNSIDRIPVVGFFWHLYRGYSRRNGPLLSAGIAYYGLFSMGPLLILTLQIAGHLFGNGPPAPGVRLIEAVSEYVGPDMAAILASVMTRFTSGSADSTTWAIVSLGILLYGATRLFVRLQASFNIMWDVRIISRAFSFRRLMSRLLVFGLILVPIVLLVVALVLGTAVRWLEHLVDGSGLFVSVAQAAIPFLITWLALIIVFVVLPDIHLRIRDCWFTSLLVAVAWAVGTRVFGAYLSWSGSQRYAGAVGALIGLIFWVDVLAIITLLGVRFNKAIYLWRGKVIQPYEYAAPVTELPDVESTAAGRDRSGTPPGAV